MQIISISRLDAIDFARNLLNAAFDGDNDIVDRKHEFIYHITSETEQS
ncbi:MULTISPECIES: hypothetical protein [Bifidobacterium]|jgi:hypothetical protein|nr:hypothetical protein [Bifidobacterium tibiigranuli]MCI1212074.1 hypothetical protein [Bifidobacterium tibiigranuli]